MVRLPPVARNCADRVFYHPGRFGPFADATACFDNFEGFHEPAHALIGEPPGTADCQIGARREREHDFVFAGWRHPEPDVGADKGYVAFRPYPVMLDVDTDTFVSGFRPRPHHVPRAVAKAKHRSLDMPGI